MNSDKLYKVQEQDLDRLKEILTVCFQIGGLQISQN